MKKAPLFLTLCLAAGSLQAEAPRPLQGFLAVGLTFGGDTLGKVYFSDGSTDSVKAGGTRLFKGGLNYTVSPQFSIQAGYGIHLESSKKANNGGINFDRTFMEGLAFYHTSETFKVGGGIRKILDAKLKGTGAAATERIDFDGQLGLVAEVEWHTRHISNIQWGLTLRYVNEKYSPSSLNGFPIKGEDVDGSHFGVGVSFYF